MSILSFHRRLVVIFLVAVTVWVIWLTLLGPSTGFSHIINNWEISFTMVFGSMVAGGTSLGGGAVAFPVFTKVLQISPYDAKVFSLAIQSVGMVAATVVIWLTGIKVEWRVILYGSLAGIGGVWFGLGVLAPLFSPDVLKISFSLMLVSFAMTLFFLNSGIRECHSLMPSWGTREKLIISITAMFGGIISGLMGTGIDIFVFAVMVLLFRISEKVATPTSVILMAVNAVTGFALQVFVFGDFSVTVQHYWLAAIPVVVVGAPLGAILCSLMSRKTIANILIVVILLEFISSLVLISLRPLIVYYGLVVFVLATYINYFMYRTQIYNIPVVQRL